MTSSGPFSHWQHAIQPREESADESPASGNLPPTFQFSQNNLQDYVDCARRFQLRYVLGQRWPAVETEPLTEHEHFMEQGSQFHLLVQRHLMGIPPDKLTPRDPLLREWWESYLAANPLADLPAGFRRPEVQLSVPFGEQRLVARFDLLAIQPGERAVIVDWKTTRFRPDRKTLSARLQSRVYPFVLAEGGAHLFGGPLAPEQITLIYWFAADPALPEVFLYNSVEHEANRDYLTHLLGDLLGRREEVWPLTSDLNHCRYCVYRSLCDRGVEAGGIEDALLDTAEPAFDFELADIDEIEF